MNRSHGIATPIAKFRLIGMANTVQKAGTPWGAIFSLLAALGYGVSPIDLIPDIIPLIGWLDDAVAVPLFIIFAFALFNKFKKGQRISQARPANAVIDIVDGEPVIPQSYHRAQS